MGVFPELKLTHLIPEQRSTDDYFLRLLEGCQISETILNFKWPRTYPGDDFGQQMHPRRHLIRSRRSIRGLLSLCMNALLKRGFERRVFFAKRRGMIKGREIALAEAAAVTDVATIWNK